jgi:hypothetical protein
MDIGPTFRACSRKRYAEGGEESEGETARDRFCPSMFTRFRRGEIGGGRKEKSTVAGEPRKTPYTTALRFVPSKSRCKFTVPGRSFNLRPSLPLPLMPFPLLLLEHSLRFNFL